MQDRRIQERRNLIYYLQVFEQMSDRMLGRLVDITTNGMMLITDHQLPPGATFKLRLQLPSQEFQQEFLVFEAQSLWCRPDINPSFFDTGFQFCNLSEEDLRIVGQLVTMYGFPSTSDRIQAELLE